MFLSTYFYAKKMKGSNTWCEYNLQNARKTIRAQLRRIVFVSHTKTCPSPTMETHLLNTFLRCTSEKSCDFASWWLRKVKTAERELRQFPRKCRFCSLEHVGWNSQLGWKHSYSTDCLFLPHIREEQNKTRTWYVCRFTPCVKDKARQKQLSKVCMWIPIVFTISRFEISSHSQACLVLSHIPSY